MDTLVVCFWLSGAACTGVYAAVSHPQVFRFGIAPVAVSVLVAWPLALAVLLVKQLWSPS